jgi:uncharacterized protein (TIGR03083 family)
VRQRRRLAGILGALSDEQWNASSRCEGWSVKDVIAHLNGTNQYWAVSIGAGVAGEPTRYLETFDPVKTPAQMVDGVRAMTPTEVLAQYLESVDMLEQAVTGLDEAAWSMLAEAPPGHIAARAVALHALWDSWIHERDIVIPLGIPPVVEDDELIACLYYAAAIGPAFTATRGSTREGTLIVSATNPDVSFVVDAGSVVVVRDESPSDKGARLTGDAIALLEGLSFRGPLDHALAADSVWLLGGLDEVFDRGGQGVEAGA